MASAAAVVCVEPGRLLSRRTLTDAATLSHFSLNYAIFLLNSMLTLVTLVSAARKLGELRVRESQEVTRP